MSGVIEQISISPGGILKRPVAEAVVGMLGVEGDAHAHPAIHGGPDKALLLIAAEVLDELQAAGFAVFAGALGENLTTRGLDHRAWRKGQRFQAGDVVFELTTVRQPCAAMNPYGAGIQRALYDNAVKAGDTTSPLWARSGFYARVIATGRIVPPQTVTVSSAPVFRED